MFVKMPVYSKVSVADKERLYQAHVRGDDYVRLAEILGINRTTVYHIIRRGNQREGVVALPRGGKRTEKVTAETQRTVLDIVHEHPDFTLVAINRELRARLPGELPCINVHYQQHPSRPTYNNEEVRGCTCRKKL